MILLALAFLSNFQFKTPQEPLPIIKKSSPWWQSFPTVGMKLEQPFWPPCYPFLPHNFSLWQLAPRLGKGISVALLDTGIAAFTMNVGGVRYKKHPNITIVSNVKENYFCYLPTHPYEVITALLKRYTNKAERECEIDAKELAFTFRITKDLSSCKNYLITHGTKELKTLLGNSLSKEGERAERMLKEVCTNLTPVTVEDPFYSEPLFFENLPAVTPGIIIQRPGTRPTSLYADHGTHVASIIGAHSCSSSDFSGLAPNCSLVMFKTVNPHSYATDLSASVKALERCVKDHIPIVNISVSCNQSWDTTDPLMKAFEQACSKIPFVCVAVGNDKKNNPHRITYPARCSGIHFSVGAFGYFFDEKKNVMECTIAPFCQTEEKKGPRYLAPGVDVLGCTYESYSHEPSFGTRSGSSSATAFLSGFLALLVSEYGADLTSDQIKELCDNSCVRLHATTAWKNEVLCGVVDMRTALFIARVLVIVKKKIGTQRFNQRFSFFLKSITTILFSLPDEYGTKSHNPYQFKEHYIDYIMYAQKQFSKGVLPMQKELCADLHKAINEVTAEVLLHWRLEERTL